MAFGANEHEADTGVGAECLDEVGVAVVELLECGPPFDLWERDQAEAARRHHGHLGRPLRAFLLPALVLAARLVPGAAEADGAILPGRASGDEASDGACDAGRGRPFRGGSVQVPPAFVDASRHEHLVGTALLGHEVGKGEPVALLERRSLRLAVIGEDDEAVGPGCVLGRPGEARERLVDLRKLPQRLRPFDPGVMGDLVVAEKHRVDRRPAAVEILDRGRHLQLRWSTFV